MTHAKINQALSSLAVSIDTLHEDPDNARSHDERNIESIKSSLARFGQQKPIVVDSSGCVLAGNGTLTAAKLLGWKEIAVSVSDLTDEMTKRAFAIADNKTAELASWDFPVLAESLASLQSDSELLMATGFSDFEIQPLINADWDAGKKHDDSDDSSAQGEKTDFKVSFTQDQWDLWVSLKDREFSDEQITDAEAMSFLFSSMLKDSFQ